MILHCFQAVAGRLTDPLVLVSSSGVVLAANPPALRFLGNDTIGTSLIDRANDPSTFRRFLQLASRSSSPIPGQARFDGKEVRWRCDASAVAIDDASALLLQLHAGSEAVHRFLTLNEQIDRLQAEIRRRRLLETEREQMLLAQQKARASAEEANRFKDELLASVSHELRTPLHAISGWISILRDHPNDTELLRRGLDVIERNVVTETQLTEDLVDTSLVITGRMRLSIQPVDLEQVVRQAIESVQPAIDAREQRLELIANIGDCVVNGDRERLLQIVWNLLSNATKYTPRKGRIQVVVRRVDSHVEIVVSDDGEGIDAALLPYVFERFRRADATSTRRHGGLGLGLAIVRHLVELHGGFVMAHSEGIGHGTTFTVNLPLPAFQRRSAASS
ncbi:MAG: HAMP domain-containing histidine kinase, partial [Myxococcales bacterium]|nr:HAMP domain-containing histidine kinase [Myxococcales bacterium]